MEIYNQNESKIKKLKELIGDRKKIKLIGKGPTAKYCKNNEEYYTIGVKQGIIFSENQDILFLTDFEGIFGLENIYDKIKFVICPYYPNICCSKNDSKDFKFIISYLKNFGFTGEYILIKIYNNDKNQNNTKLKEKYSYQSQNSTTEIIVQFMSSLFNINHYEFYGINKGKGYHKDIKNLDFSISKTDCLSDIFINHYNKIFKNNLNEKEAIIRDKKVDLYSKRRVKYKFRPQIEKFSKKYNFTYNYN